jgi:hypothetical protein
VVLVLVEVLVDRMVMAVRVCHKRRWQYQDLICTVSLYRWRKSTTRTR